MAPPGRSAPDPEEVAGVDLAALRTRLHEQSLQVRSTLLALRGANQRIGREVAARRESEVQRRRRPRDRPPPAPGPLPGSHIDAAEALLLRLLAAGPMRTLELERRARAAGISSRTLARARRRLGVRALRVGGLAERGAWYCRLCTDARTG